MKLTRPAIGIMILTISALAIGGCTVSKANEEDTKHTASPVKTEDPADEPLIGGTPGSCGYQWDADRNGWHRPWDADSFIPAEQKPEWREFIPATNDPDPITIAAAPITSVEAVLAESFPPQVIVNFTGTLADACTTLHEVNTERQGNTIEITVTTARAPDAMCAQVLGEFRESVNLGSDFTPGTTYTISVNGMTTTMKMQ